MCPDIPPELSQIELRTDWRGRYTESCYHFYCSLESEALVVRVDAPFFNDPPPGASPGLTWRLWEYEVVELFLLGDNDEYLELEFGPHGHYLALMLNGRRNITARPPLHEFLVSQRRLARWQCRAVVPLSYLPTSIKSFNACAVHGVQGNRRYLSLSSTDAKQPDFHDLSQFIRLRSKWHRWVTEPR